MGTETRELTTHVWPWCLQEKPQSLQGAQDRLLQEAFHLAASPSWPTGAVGRQGLLRAQDWWGRGLVSGSY